MATTKRKTPAPKPPAELSAVDQLKAMIEQAGNPIIADDAVSYGEKFQIPYGTTYKQAINILRRKEKEEETVTNFSRTFNYRPWDGANATWEVIRRRFGITIAKAIKTLFGERPPEMRTIEIGFNKTAQVPWGILTIPMLENAEFHLHAAVSGDYGVVFAINGTAKRKYRDQIESMYDEIEQELRHHSIYQGQAIVGCQEPKFLDMASFDPNRVVYSEEVRRQLQGTLWAPIRYTDAMRRDAIPRRRAVLLHGPYGSGKTLAGQLTADVAVRHQWTFIGARPAEDKLEDVMRMARMYEPSVVFFEDVDIAASTPERDAVSEMLDVFDGITAKGGELVVVLTTNHLERIHKGMLRPGRFDALIEIGELDRVGVERLIKVTVAEGKLGEDIDYDVIHDAMHGFFPAFITEAIHRAAAVALARVEGAEEYQLTTEDLETSALGLRDQLQIMRNAQEGPVKPDLTRAMERLVRGAVDGTAVEEGGMQVYELAVDGEK